MIYSVCYYTVNTIDAPAFILAIRDGGRWRDLLRLSLPGYVASSVLRSAAQPSVFLVIHFFLSAEAHGLALKTPIFAEFTAFADTLARAKQDLGIFIFPMSAAEPDSDAAAARLTQNREFQRR